MTKIIKPVKIQRKELSLNDLKDKEEVRLSIVTTKEFRQRLKVFCAKENKTIQGLFHEVMEGYLDKN